MKPKQNDETPEDLTNQLRAAGASISGPLEPLANQFPVHDSKVTVIGDPDTFKITALGLGDGSYYDRARLATAPAPQLSEAQTRAFNALVDTIGQELDKKLDAVIEAATKIKLALHDEREVVRGAVVELARKTLEDAAPLAEALEREVDDLLARR